MATSGKSAGLLRLRAIGLPVPDFTVFTWEELTSGLALDDRPAAALRKELKQRLLHSQIIPDLPADRLYAVRSSASVEDSEDLSFAGIFRTFLDVPLEDVPERMTDAVLSLLAPAGRLYAENHGVSLSELAMDIIIQEMVDAEISGILFTSHPQGLLSETVIQVGYGAGDGVVGGQTPVTSYFHNPVEQTLYYVPDEGSPLLSQPLIDQLIDAAGIAGAGRDLEFSIVADKIYFLQLRPITTLADERVILDNSNLVESYPGITLPLSISFARLAYASVFSGLARRLLKQAFTEPMVAAWHGRLYYRIDSWYRMLEYLPHAERIIPIWQDMMGVENRSYTPTKPALGFFKRVRFYLRVIGQFLTVPRQMRALDRWFRELERDYRKRLRPGLSADELKALFRNLETELTSRWDITLLNDLYAFLFTGLLRKGLPDDSRISTQALTGLSDLASLEPVLALLDLVRLHGSPEYPAARSEFLRLYGDRSPEELKLETETFRSDPELLDQSVAYYAAQPEVLESRVRAIHAQQAKDRAAGTALVRNLPWAERLRLKLWSGPARTGIRNRELSRFHRSRIYGLVREILLELAKHLDLEDTRDVFYLELAEVMNPPADLPEIVRQRKARYELYRSLPTYSRVEFAGEIFEKNHRRIGDLSLTGSAADLSGTPCSNGEVEGEVLVTYGNEAAEQTRGKILVAPLTDPGWVYLLVQAKGLITEKGSLLSHTGIIARELGIPAITGVKDATRKLKTGDRIRLNGATGEIEVLE